MQKLTASLMLALVATCGLLGSGSAAEAATKHPILRSVTSYVIYDNSESHCVGETSSVLTAVKLRKGHIAADLTADIYIGKKWKVGRVNDVRISGRTSVKFYTCVPYRLLFNAKTGATYNTRIVVTTMPRSRDTMGSRIIDND